MEGDDNDDDDDDDEFLKLIKVDRCEEDGFGN